MISFKPPENVSPSLVKQYAYCPVIVWIKSWLMVQEPVTDSMKIAVEQLSPPRGMGQVVVKTESGATIIDEVVEERGFKVLVERKAYVSYNQSRFVEQAVASYLIARNRIPGLRAVKLELPGKTRTIELGEDLVNEVERLVEKTREILVHETTPPRPGDPRKCTSCWYKRYCPHS